MIPQIEFMNEDQVQVSQWAKELLHRNKWAILDMETTGLDSYDQIIQVGIITSELLEGYQTLVKPTVPIKVQAQQVHCITNAMVEMASPMNAVFLEILKIVRDFDLVIYNADFELRLIKQSMRAHGIQLAFPTSDRRGCRIFTNGGSIHCAMQWYSQWTGDWSDRHGNYKWQKLPGADHSVLGDCKAILEVIKKMAASE